MSSSHIGIFFFSFRVSEEPVLTLHRGEIGGEALYRKIMKCWEEPEDELTVMQYDTPPIQRLLISVSSRNLLLLPR